MHTTHKFTHQAPSLSWRRSLPRTPLATNQSNTLQRTCAHALKHAHTIHTPGSQSELEALIAKSPKFADIFESRRPTGSPPACPAGFRASNQPSLIYRVTDPATYANYFMECLKVGPAYYCFVC